jgi:excinuclease UvrABC nuclease subunit
MDIESRIPMLMDLLGQLLAAETIPFAQIVPHTLPPQPGVYRIFETALPSDTVYIGRTESLRNRIYGSHLMGNRGVSTLKRKLLRDGRYPGESDVKAYMRHDCSVQYAIVPAAVDRLRLEHFAIALLRPWYND